jgi:nitroreductase
METLECIKTRKSFRAFKPTPVTKDVLGKILQAASDSPSFTNTQPWEAFVISGKKKDELVRRLLELAKTNAPMKPDFPMPKSFPPAMEERSRVHGARRLETLGVARDDAVEREKLRLMNFEFYGAPCAVFVFIDGSVGEWSVFDIGLFSQTLMLAAHSLGVESCLQASVTNYAPEVKTFLGIAESKKMVISIVLGYPDEKAKLNTYRALKQKPEEFTKWLE